MFNSNQFLEVWEEWKQHLKEKTLQAYTQTAERKALSALFQKSDGREQLAIDSINYSIEKNWSAIHLKPIENGNRQTNGSHTGQSGTSSNRMEAARKW